MTVSLLLVMLCSWMLRWQLLDGCDVVSLDVELVVISWW